MYVYIYIYIYIYVCMYAYICVYAVLHVPEDLREDCSSKQLSYKDNHFNTTLKNGVLIIIGTPFCKDELK